MTLAYTSLASGASLTGVTLTVISVVEISPALSVTVTVNASVPLTSESGV